MASLTIYIPEQEPYALTLDGYDQLSVGRGPDNDIVLDHVSMSGSHAVIFNLGGTFQVQDLSSTNGTYLNGDPVSEAVLTSGARVTFGSVDAIFQDEAVAEVPSFASSSGGSGYASGHVADIAEVSNRPPGFTNLSPIEKVVKKDTLGAIAMIVGGVAILAGIVVVVLSSLMKAV